MPNLVLRFDMRNPPFGASQRELYDTVLDMAVWAEQQGFDLIQLSEHHGSEDGYLPSPIVLAAAIAARTSRIRLRFALITLPFNNPLKLAEDLAVLDIISNGRVEVVLGAGYVAHEFDMFGAKLSDRGRIMEEGIETIKKAWTGKPFTYQGRTVTVTPTPVQKPRPPIWMGGSSPAAAKRAARIADYFYVGYPELYQIFRDEAIKLGRDPGPWGDIGCGFLVVTEDPDAEWKILAPHILHETNSYGRWQEQTQMHGQYVEVTDIEPLKNTPLYPVLTPAQAIEYARERGDNGNVCLHPLVAGLAPDIAWRHLHTFAEKVLPVVRNWKK
jgi:alkanesulfonate monooxygenase SsuD/methylene tetrahydromethanopterin reductase-like flavin-dependent oxidoreductase (luciferase family)